MAARLPVLIEAWRGRNGEPSSARLSREDVAKAGGALLELQRGLTGERRLAGRRYMDSPELLGAYLLYYWPVSYMQVSLALAESRSRPSAPARRVLDIGSGPGPASAALLDALADRGEPPPEELVLVDASRGALDLAVSILSRGSSEPPRISTFQIDIESEEELPPGRFDFIVVGHCLNELWRGRADALERRAALVRRAAASLSPGGVLLLVEPALLLTSRELIAIRDRLAAEGWAVTGPCPGSYPCPAFAAGPERSCHAESPWAPPEPVASLAAAAGLDRSSVKWTHFFLSPRPRESEAEAPAMPTGDRSGSPSAPRVVSDPMLNKAGRLRYILCGAGSLTTISARADDPSARESGFGSLRRGDRVRYEGLEERAGGGLGFTLGSRLGLAAHAPEASP